MAAFAGMDSEKGEIVSDKSRHSDKHGPDKAGKAQDKAALVPAVVPAERHARLPDRDPPEGIRALAADYPLALVAGGLVAGVVIGAMLPRSGRLSRSVTALAAVAGELGLSYARKAVDGMSDAAEAAAEAGRKVSGGIAERAGEIAGAAGERAGDYSGKAAEAAEEAMVSLRHSAEGLARQVIRLTSHLRH